MLTRGLLSLVFLALSVLPVQAVSLLIGGEERFEGTLAQLQARWPSCSPGAPFGPNGSGNFASQSSVNSFEGTFNLRLNFTGTYHGGGNCERQLTTSVTEFWMTWTEYLSADWQFPMGNDVPAAASDTCVPNIPTLVCGIGTKNWYPRGGGGNPHTVYMGQNGKLIGQCQGCWDAHIPSQPHPHYDTWNLTQNQGVDFVIPLQHHVCYEHHVKLNDPSVANGLVELWVDDLSVPGFVSRRVLHYTGMEYRAPVSEGTNVPNPWNGRISSVQAFRQSGYGGAHKDMFDVTDVRKGCPGSAPPVGDTTPPTAPSSLSAQATSGTTMGLAWTNGTDTLDTNINARIERCTVTSGTTCTNFSLISTQGVTGGAASTFSSTGLTTDTRYCFRINNQDLTGNQGPYSNTSCATTAVSARTTLVVENFNRADSGDLALTWDPGYGTDTPLALVSQQVRPTALNQDALETYNGITWPNDQWAQFTLSQVGGSGLIAPRVLVRFANPPTKSGYECGVILPNITRCAEWNAGVFTEKTNVTTWTYQAGDSIRVQAEGTDIALYVKRGTTEQLLTSFVDSTFTGGRAGIIHFHQSGVLGDVQLDDFEGGGFGVQVVLPAMASVEADLTQAIVEWQGAPIPAPTTMRVATSLASVVEPLTAFPALTERVTQDSDLYTRANNVDIGTEWNAGVLTVFGATNPFTLTSNAVHVSALGADSIELFNVGTITSGNQWAGITFSTVATPTAALKANGLVLRADVSGGVLTGYDFRAFMHTGVTRARIGRWSPQGFTVLAESSAVTWAASDILRAEAEGTQLRLYRNDVLVLSASDSTYTTGQPAIIGHIASGTTVDIIMDNFEAGGFIGTTSHRYTYHPTILSSFPGSSGEICFYPRASDGTENVAGRGCDTVTFPPSTGPITVGPREDLMCAPELGIPGCLTKPYSWPDGTMGIRKVGNLYTFWGSNAGQANRLQGTLTNPGATTNENFVIGQMKDTFEYVGAGPVYDAGGGLMLMFYHAEEQNPSNFHFFFGLIGLAKSTDNGVTWRDLGIVLRHHTPMPSPNTAINFTRNIGEGAFIIKREAGIDYFWLYHENAVGPGTTGFNWANISVARARVSDVLAAASTNSTPAFFRYCNGGFNAGSYTVVCPGGLWTEPGLGGLSTKLEVENHFIHLYSIAFNTVLQKYVMVGQCGNFPGTTAVWTANPACIIESVDGLTWTNAQVLFEEVCCSAWHPSWIGTGEDPQNTLGATAYVYYIYTPAPYSNQTNRLSRRVVTFSAAAGSPPNMTNPQPTIPLQPGTTQATMSIDFDKSALCRYATTNSPFGNMTLAMTTVNLTASVVFTGLTNGFDQTYFMQCQHTDVNGATYPTTTAQSARIQVLTPTDTTAPVRSGVSPQGVQPFGTNPVVVTLTTNENATCKGDTVPGTAYAAMPQTFAGTGTQSHTLNVATVNGGSYQICTRCSDTVPNVNITDDCSVFTVAAAAPDTSPPVLTAPLPVGEQTLGTTDVSLEVTSSENATLRYGTDLGVPYEFMDQEFATGAGTTAHATPITGLQNCQTYSFAIRGIDALGNANLTDFIHTFTVACPVSDTTKPSTVPNLVATALGESQIELTYGIATDNVLVTGYNVYQCQGVGCSTFVFARFVPGVNNLLTIMSNLVQVETYSFQVRAVDAALNESASPGVTATATTFLPADVTPPSIMTGFQVSGIEADQATLSWLPGTDDRGSVFSNIEMCIGVGCTNFAVLFSHIGTTTITPTLLPNTFYRFRGIHNDNAGNVSANPLFPLVPVYSEILEFLTDADGSINVGACNCKNKNHARY